MRSLYIFALCKNAGGFREVQGLHSLALRIHHHCQVAGMGTLHVFRRVGLTRSMHRTFQYIRAMNRFACGVLHILNIPQKIFFCKT